MIEEDVATEPGDQHKQYKPEIAHGETQREPGRCLMFAEFERLALLPQLLRLSLVYSSSSSASAALSVSSMLRCADSLMALKRR